MYYDYIGIEKWYLGEWKAKSTIAIKYQEFARTAKTKINVVFHKVKSHTNNYYNELVDKLAKEALLWKCFFSSYKEKLKKINCINQFYIIKLVWY